MVRRTLLLSSAHLPGSAPTPESIGPVFVVRYTPAAVEELCNTLFMRAVSIDNARLRDLGYSLARALVSSSVADAAPEEAQAARTRRFGCHASSMASGCPAAVDTGGDGG